MQQSNESEPRGAVNTLVSPDNRKNGHEGFGQLDLQNEDARLLFTCGTMIWHGQLPVSQQINIDTNEIYMAEGAKAYTLYAIFLTEYQKVDAEETPVLSYESYMNTSAPEIIAETPETDEVESSEVFVPVKKAETTPKQLLTGWLQHLYKKANDFYEWTVAGNPGILEQIKELEKKHVNIRELRQMFSTDYEQLPKPPALDNSRKGASTSWIADKKSLPTSN